MNFFFVCSKASQRACLPNVLVIISDGLQVAADAGRHKHRDAGQSGTDILDLNLRVRDQMADTGERCPINWATC